MRPLVATREHSHEDRNITVGYIDLLLRHAVANDAMRSV